MITLVTGASGFVGNNLIRALIARGRTVRALVRKRDANLDRLGVEQVIGDTTDPDTLPEAFEDVEVVFHLAALVQVGDVKAEQLFRTNVEGPRNVAAAALAAGVRRMVHCSSCHALYEHPLYAPIDETRALALSDDCLPYSRSKAEGEVQVLEAVAEGLDAVICNPTGIIGPYDERPSHLGELFIMLHERAMPALIDATYDFVDVRDVVEGLLAAEARGRKGERYLLSGHRVNVKQLAGWAEAATGVKSPTLTSPMWLAMLGAPFVAGWAKLRGQRPIYSPEALEVLRGNSDFDHSKATEELGYEPRPMEETVKGFYEWYLPWKETQTAKA
jgi:dihydroflavonol-4-reductase